VARHGTDAESTPARASGLLASLQRLMATFAGILHTRIEILSTELEEEWIRLRELFFYGLISAFFLGLGLLLVTAFVILAFWESHRLSVLAVFAVLYLAIGVGAALAVRHKLKTRPRLLSATISELGKDRERLASRS
jgi:uncharacterized membrane protein YqjE